jgi:hypothetical protein
MDIAKLRELLKEKNAPKAVSELAFELATYADDDGNIMIGQFAPIVTYEDMATICGTSETTIKRKMKWLLSHGVIVRTPINEIGSVKVYAYRFKLEKGFRKGFDLPSKGRGNDIRRISDKQAKNEENESQDLSLSVIIPSSNRVLQINLELPALPYHLSLQTRSYYKKRL